MTQLSMAQARRRLADLLRQVESGASVTISRRGKPVAVLVSVEIYRRLERADAYLQALEISSRLRNRPGVPDALAVARAAREELEARG